MGQYIRKTITGFREVEPEDAEYYLQTIDDYYRFVEELQRTKNKLTTINRKHSEELERLTISALQDSDYEIQKEKKDAQKKYDALYAKYTNAIERAEYLANANSELKEKSSRYESLNQNLLRVSRERANVDNGQDKKTASGFVVLSTMQIRDKLPNQDGYDEYFDTWRTRIRTHFDASIPMNTIIPEIMSALQGGIVSALGIEEILLIEDMSDLEQIMDRCVVYRWLLSASFVISGCWEIDLFHTKPIYIPEEYRPIRPQKKDKKERKPERKTERNAKAEFQKQGQRL